MLRRCPIQFQEQLKADNVLMTAEIIQFIPKPNPNRQRELEKEAAAILEGGSTVVAPYGGQGTDGMTCESDPA